MSRPTPSVSAVIALVMLAGCAASRPVCPPGASPWGALDVEDRDAAPEDGLERSLTAGFAAPAGEQFDADADGHPTYPLLALSGGGARGAYAVGVLCGWSARGDRPAFKVVTGISTGALIATHAFLGPEYDKELRELYTTIETRHVVRNRPFGGLFSISLKDSQPLRDLIGRHIDASVLDAVAKEHRSGRRLYVGTASLDTNEFVIWDMGAVAASGRPDRVERYCDVLLASCSVPVVMPPVEFEVDVEGARYSQLHVDGGMRAPVFFRGFMLDLEDALERLGLDRRDVQTELYVIISDYLRSESAPGAVPLRLPAIAGASVEALYEEALLMSVYRMYVLAERQGVRFRLTAIPDDFELEMWGLDFNPIEMRRLFELGYERAQQGAAWLRVPPRLDPQEIVAAEDER